MAGANVDRESACSSDLPDTGRRDERVSPDVPRTAAFTEGDQAASLRDRVRRAAQDVAGHEEPYGREFSGERLLPGLAGPGGGDLQGGEGVPPHQTARGEAEEHTSELQSPKDLVCR